MVVTLKNTLTPDEFETLKVCIHKLPFPVISNIISEMLNKKSIQKNGFKKILY